MVNVTISFDPADERDLQRARDLLDRLGDPHFRDPRPGTSDPDPEAVHQKVIALLRGYGPKRTEYIREVAKASPGSARYEDLVAIVGSPKAIGGTHSSIERAWRAKGMSGPFIETDLNGNAKMDMRLADIVLFALHEMDEPDPLSAARY
jgi:hypothetical protein